MRLVYRSVSTLIIMLLGLGCAKAEHTATQSAAQRPTLPAKPGVMNEEPPAATPAPAPTPAAEPEAHPVLPVSMPTVTPEPDAIPPVPMLPKAPAAPAAPATKTRQDTDLVSLAEIDPTIVIDIQLAHPENVFHYQFFKENAAYVRHATAKKIAAVQRRLRQEGLGLKIWSAYRPLPVQIKMYEIVGRNGDWVSDPYDEKSKKAHVRGVAIDCTLVDSSGRELEMPTSYLDFKNAEKMAADYMDLPERVIANRKRLREAMLDQGMSPYSKEWWHFQDNKIMQYPPIRISDFPELHRRMLVAEMLKLGGEFEASQAAKAKSVAGKIVP